MPFIKWYKTRKIVQLLRKIHPAGRNVSVNNKYQLYDVTVYNQQLNNERVRENDVNLRA